MRTLPLLLALLLLAGSVAAAENPSALEGRIRRLVAGVRGQMRVGVAVIHLASGERVEVDASDPYPLASVFKLPVMVELVRQIQTGETALTLQSALTVREEDRCIGGGRLKHVPAGTRVTVERCLELMETVSDNTAADLLFQRIGTDSVNRLMHGMGLKSADIYLTNRAAYLVALGLGSEFRGMGAREIAQTWRGMDAARRRQAVRRILEENRHLTLAEFQRAEDASAARQTGQAYLDDVAVAAAVDNLASPADMAAFLARLYRGEILDEKWTRYCLDVLSRQQLNRRIPRLLPEGTRVYHKTGTIAGVVNDAGIIEIAPGNALVVVVFCRDVAEGAQEKASRVIGRIARMAWEAYRPLAKRRPVAKPVKGSPGPPSFP